MKQFNNNVKTANIWVTEQCEEISKAGEKNEDLIIQLFSLYLTSPCEDFKRGIKDKKRMGKGSRHQRERFDDACFGSLQHFENGRAMD